MSEKINELAEKDKIVELIKPIFYQEVLPSANITKIVAIMENIATVVIAAGYRKPAPSEKLVEEWAKIIEKETGVFPEYALKVARSIASLLPEMKGEELEKIAIKMAGGDFCPHNPEVDGCDSKCKECWLAHFNKILAAGTETK